MMLSISTLSSMSGRFFTLILFRHFSLLILSCRFSCHDIFSFSLFSPYFQLMPLPLADELFRQTLAPADTLFATLLIIFGYCHRY
jgi:hypothetical protein